MKHTFILLLSILFFAACHEELPSYTIKGTVLYGGDRNKPVDGILITLQKNGESHIYESKRTTYTGEYEITDLSAGTYTLTASGWGVDTLVQTIQIPIASDRRDIDMTQAIIKPQIFQNGKPVGDAIFDMTENPSLNFDILNANREAMHWEVVNSNDDWFSVSPTKGDIPRGEQYYAFTIKIDRNKLQCNMQPATINLNSNKGSTTLRLTATKTDCVGQAAIEIIENPNCGSVTLKAKATNANSYKWYKDNSNNIIPDANLDTYQATDNGIYYAVGINAKGETGLISEPFPANITLCPVKPAKPAIQSSATQNDCAAGQASVTLTASATGAVTGWQWYDKNGSKISGATNVSYEVKTTGRYSVAAKNEHGEGERSDEREITIIACPAKPATAIISGNSTNSCPSTKVILTANAQYADSYKWYKGTDDTPFSTANPLTVTEEGIYYAKGVNASGESVDKSLPKNVTIGCATLTGTLKDRDGIAMKNVTIELRTGKSLTATTNSQGVFVFQDIQPGNYSLSVRNVTNYTDIVNKSVTVVAGDNTVDLTMNITNPFSINVNDGNGFVNDNTVNLVYETFNGNVGTTVNQIIQIKNNRQTSLSWSLSNVPAYGISFSPSNGTVESGTTVSITVAFTHPHKGLANCVRINSSSCLYDSVSYTYTYVWNWSNIWGGRFNSSDEAGGSSQNISVNVGENQKTINLEDWQFTCYSN